MATGISIVFRGASAGSTKVASCFFATSPETGDSGSSTRVACEEAAAASSESQSVSVSEVGGWKGSTFSMGGNQNTWSSSFDFSISGRNLAHFS